MPILSFRAVPLAAAVVALTLMVPRSSHAQATGGDELSRLKTAYLADYAEMEKKFVGLAEASPADKYGWRPMDGVRSVSQVFALIAGESYSSLTKGFGGTQPAGIPTGEAGLAQLEKMMATKAEAVRHLKAAFALARTTITNWKGDPAKPMKFWGVERPLAGVFTMVAGDQHEHLGQLIAYARMNRIVPPWSR